MTSNESHFDEFHDHTELKHLVLNSYLRAWATVVLGQKHHAHAWFIDAFAGRGSDSTGKLGSPLIACRVATEIAEKHGPANDGTPPLQIIAIENHVPTHAALLNSTAKCQSEGYLTVLQGKLEDHLDNVLARGAPGDPRVFFLDPFGVKGLSADIVKRLLARERTEVLVLFHDTGANRLHGAANKQPAAGEVRDDRISLFDYSSPSDGARSKKKLAAAEATAPAAANILRIAFGNQGYERAATVVACQPPHTRQREWLVQYVRTLHDLGAKYVVSFSVCDRESNHRYYLVHASTHPRAIHKMKEAIQTAKIQHDKGATQEPLFYQTTVDVTRTADMVRDRFSGRTVRWQDGTNSNTVKMFLIECTDALMSDLPDIQKQLVERGWLIQKKPITYTIP